MNAIPEHVSIWGELGDVDHTLRHVDVGGVRTRVLQAGSGPDLILLHGTGGHLEAYARDIAGLAGRFRVTAYDMVGHGWSDLPDTPYTIDVLSDHLIGLMDALGISRAHLSGESLGGWVTAWTAAYHPDRVDRLVLNTPGNIANKPEVMARMRDSTLAAVRDPSDATVRRRVEFLFHHKELVTDELVNLRRSVYSRDGFLRAISNTLVLQDPEVRKDFAWDPGWVGKVTAPTLLLWTEHDPTGGLDEAAMLLDWLPDARLHVIADAGHWPQWEKPDEFLRRPPRLPDPRPGPVVKSAREHAHERACERISKHSAPANAADERQRGGLMSEIIGLVAMSHSPFATMLPPEDASAAGRPVPRRRRPGGVGRRPARARRRRSSSAPTTSTRTSTT